MKKIDPEYWNQFKDTKFPYKYNGIKFENLVNELLKLMYGTEWHSTKKSHDNNRDFWIELNNQKMWAECKNYNDTIAMNVLAPTLVMAQIYNTNIILFFSRSRINSKAKDKILAFGEEAKKEIVFFDAEILENLIMEKRAYLPKKFQPKILKEEQDYARFEVSIYFFQNAINTSVITDDEFMDYLSASKVHYNEIFSLKIIIHNPYPNRKIEVKISFSENNPDRYKFEYLDHDINSKSSLWKRIYLEPGEGIAKTMHLRPTVYSPQLMLPRFNIQVYDRNQLLSEWESEEKKLQCTWVGQTKLIGSEYEEILVRVKSQLTNNAKFSLLLLEGTSGTGKTRMLMECSAIFLKDGYKVLHLTSMEEYSSFYLLKEIIYFLYEIPKELIISELEKKLNKSKIKEQVYLGNIALTMIQEIEDLTTEGALFSFVDKFGDILFEKLSAQKCVLLVDNIQFSGSAFQYFLKQYIYYSCNQSRSNYSVFLGVFNEDYMTSEVSRLLFDIIQADVKYKLAICLYGFKELEQGVLFLRELIHVSNEQYDGLFKELINRVSLKPYNLYHSIKFLEEENIIKVSKDNQGYIFVSEEYENSKLKLCNNFIEVLNRRWEFIIKEYGEDNVNSIFSFFYFFERLNQEILSIFELDLNIVNNLCKRHFLKKDNTCDIYEFDHDIIRKYFESEHRGVLLTCFSKIRQKGKASFLKQFSTLNEIYHFTQENNINFIAEVGKNIPGRHISSRLSQIYYEELFNKCICNNQAFESDIQWIEILQSICVNIRKNSGSKSAAEFYKRVFNLILSIYGTFDRLYSYAFRQLIHSYCDILLELHEREETEILIQTVLEKTPDVKNLNKEQSDERYVLRAIMYNRWYVCYNNSELTEEVKTKRTSYMKRSRDNMKYIKNSQKRNLISYLNYSDEGYNYYGYLKDKEKLFEIWDNCLTGMPEAAPEKTLNYYRKLIQYDLINQDYDGLMNHIALGRDYLENGEYSHEPLIFATFFIMAEIMGNLQKYPQQNHFYTKKLIEDVIRIQQLLKNGKMGDILLVKGVDAYYSADLKEVYYSFKKSYEEYQLKKTSRYWIKQNLLLENIHRAFTELQIYQEGYDVSFLPEKYRTPLTVEQLESTAASGIQRTCDAKMNLALFN